MIRLLPTNQNFTLIPNSFILHHMAKMNSSVIKVYLFLLYQFSQQYSTLELDEIADTLQLTESDIFRAMKHLSKENLLICQKDGENYTEIALPSFETNKKDSVTVKSSKNKEPMISTLSFSPNIEESNALDTIAKTLPSPFTPNQRPSYPASVLEDFAKDVSGDQLIFFTQALLKKNLSSTDLQILFSFHDWLGMSFDLIQFLIEYCAENNHTRMNYIEKVAINWHENHIETIEQAKDYLATYPSYYYTILKAYGIYNLAPIPAQVKMIDKWTKEYLFPIDTIIYACEKTILQTGKPELNYTDSILTRWKEKNLFTKEQIQQEEKNTPKKEYLSEQTSFVKKHSPKTTTFTNYEQRKEDYDAIEKKALEMRIKKKEIGE